MPPTTALKPPHIAWICRAKQHCYSRAAVPARDVTAQCVKAVHINVGTFVQLLGPSPLELNALTASGVGAAMAPPMALKHWPTVPLAPWAARASKPASAMLARLPMDPVRIGAGMQSIAIGWALRTLAGQWPGCAQERAALPSWQQQVAQRGLLVLPEWGLEWGAARATGWGLRPLAAGLTTAAALCPRLATGLRVLGDVHRAVCALPLAVGALILGLTVDFWLIAWRAYQGTARSTESYLYAPCAPPEPPRGCWRASGPNVLDRPAPPDWDNDAKEAHGRAQLLRLHVRTFLNFGKLLKSNPQLRGLFFENVEVADYILQTEACLLRADTPEFRHEYMDSVNFARTEGPKVEDLGEQWLAATEVPADEMKPVRGEENAEFRNRHLWILKQAFELTPTKERLDSVKKKVDCRQAFLRQELLDAIDPAEYRERVNRPDVGNNDRRKQVMNFKESMGILLNDLQTCWHLSTMQGKKASRGLVEMLQKDQAFFALLNECAEEIDRQLRLEANKRKDLDREGLMVSLEFWNQVRGSQKKVQQPRDLLRMLHPDKLMGKRADFVQDVPEQTWTDEIFEALIKKANPLFNLLNTLYQAAKEAQTLEGELPPAKNHKKRA